MTTATPEDDPAADFVVVGAGSAGCVLALRLAEAGHTVLVVEAGGPDRHPLTRIPAGYARLLGHPRLTWGYRTEPDEGTAGRALDYPRGRVWGGCSAINGLGHARGDPSDYDGWAQKGCTGWGWDDLLPCFKRHEASEVPGDLRGASGPLPVSRLAEVPPVVARMVEAARAVGLPVNEDMNGPRREGVALFQQTRRGRARVSAARAFLRPALATGRVRVVSHALAERVVLEGGRAVGVAYRRGGEARVARARREVALAAGAVGSPHLLMLSGIGPGAHLAAHGIAVARDLPGVGADLQDHFVVRLTYRLSDHRWSANRRVAWPRLGWEVARWLARGDGVLTWSPGMLGLFARTREGLEAPDVQMNAGPLSWEGGRIGVPEAEPGLTLGVWACRPESRGSVTLASARPGDAPRIAPRFLATRGDREATLRGLRLARRWMAAPPLAGVVVGEARPGPGAESDDDLLAFARGTGGTVYHPCGTVRMGREGSGAPLDARLRVRGVAGLRVADASVFPDIPVSNINATVLAVAERASDLVAEDARQATSATGSP